MLYIELSGSIQVDLFKKILNHLSFGWIYSFNCSDFIFVLKQYKLLMGLDSEPHKSEELMTTF